MSSVREDFASSHPFAVEQLAIGEPESLDELFFQCFDRPLFEVRDSQVFVLHVRRPGQDLVRSDANR